MKLDSTLIKNIEAYLSLRIGGEFVVCPYYISSKVVRGELGVLAGKGGTKEIEHEVRVWAKVRGFDLSSSTASEIREFMIFQHIGIDCSGFVSNILNDYLKENGHKPLIKYLQFADRSLFAKLRRMFRPIENIGAEAITSPLNTDKIEDLNMVQPGDLIRAKGAQRNAHHVAMVNKVEKDESGVVRSIGYVHSHRFYGNDNGIRFGEILITDISKPLQDQNWTEVHTDGRNYILEDFMVNVEDNGVRRLRFLDKFDLKLYEV